MRQCYHLHIHLTLRIRGREAPGKLEYKIGARGLRSICEAIMTDAMFEMPSQKDTKTFVVTKEYALEKMDKSLLNRLKAA